jgi:amidophosphoribosyltransferase
VELRGSFAFVIARPHCIYAARDPWGIRPLSIGRLGRAMWCRARRAPFSRSARSICATSIRANW